MSAWHSPPEIEAIMNFLLQRADKAFVGFTTNLFYNLNFV